MNTIGTATIDLDTVVSGDEHTEIGADITVNGGRWPVRVGLDRELGVVALDSASTQWMAAMTSGERDEVHDALQAAVGQVAPLIRAQLAA